MYRQIFKDYNDKKGGKPRENFIFTKWEKEKGILGQIQASSEIKVRKINRTDDERAGIRQEQKKM